MSRKLYLFYIFFKRRLYTCNEIGRFYSIYLLSMKTTIFCLFLMFFLQKDQLYYTDICLYLALQNNHFVHFLCYQLALCLSFFGHIIFVWYIIYIKTKIKFTKLQLSNIYTSMCNAYSQFKIKKKKKTIIIYTTQIFKNQCIGKNSLFCVLT